MATNPTQVLQLTSPVNFKNQKAEKVARDSQTDGWRSEKGRHPKLSIYQLWHKCNFFKLWRHY
jgi:hypothetical protein